MLKYASHLRQFPDELFPEKYRQDTHRTILRQPGAGILRQGLPSVRILSHQIVYPVFNVAVSTSRLVDDP
jgi:hypothetical protein